MATTVNPMRQDENLKTKVQETAGNVGEKAREAAQGAADRAKETAQTVADRTREAMSNIGDRAENATHSVGKGMESLAGTLREKLPQEGIIGSAGSSVARGLETGGRYLEEEGLRGMAHDLTNLVRNNPIPALLCGVFLGFLLARVTTSRS